jgi:hypothetical protein
MILATAAATPTASSPTIRPTATSESSSALFLSEYSWSDSIPPIPGKVGTSSSSPRIVT